MHRTVALTLGCATVPWYPGALPSGVSPTSTAGGDRAELLRERALGPSKRSPTLYRTMLACKQLASFRVRSSPAPPRLRSDSRIWVGWRLVVPARRFPIRKRTFISRRFARTTLEDPGDQSGETPASSLARMQKQRPSASSFLGGEPRIILRIIFSNYSHPHCTQYNTTLTQNRYRQVNH